MAAAIYNKITNTNDADSAGTYVGSVEVHDGSDIKQYFRTTDFFELMEENGMNIRGNRTKKLLPEMIESASAVVSMAEEPFIPDYLRNSKKVLWWKVENPSFATREVSEETFNQIKSLIEEFVLPEVKKFDKLNK